MIFVSDEEDCLDNGALDGQPASTCYTESDQLVPVADLIADCDD